MDEFLKIIGLLVTGSGSVYILAQALLVLAKSRSVTASSKAQLILAQASLVSAQTAISEVSLEERKRVLQDVADAKEAAARINAQLELANQQLTRLLRQGNEKSPYISEELTKAINKSDEAADKAAAR